MTSTLKDVAKYVGLSISTVSNILSSSDSRYNKGTKERVKKAAEELDYYPNKAARAMKGQKTKVIGVLVPDLANSYFPDIIHGIEHEADKNGYQLFLCQTYYQESDEARKISLLRQHRVDGFILFPIPFSHHNKKVFEKLKKGKLPVVCIDSKIEKVSFDFVGTEDYEGAKLAVSHLAELGHKKILCLSFGDESDVRSERLRGYKDALRKNKIKFNKKFVLTAPWETDAPADFLLSLFKGKNPPTAIFAMSDLLAVWAYRNFKKSGMKIPKNVSLVGFGDLHEGKFLDTPLTTVAQNKEEMGRKAITLLLDRIKKPNSRRKELLVKTKLIERKSCAPIGA
ncbi:MAG: hypothetical protein DRI44_02050 [Chlamydiae bacterium]|nr:MAG: hypothetical protein DRI44_02050 [Chlamydiota bacterium]